MIITLKRTFLSLLCIILSLFVYLAPASAQTNGETDLLRKTLPENLGTMLYQINPTYKNQVYIIAQKHRSPFNSHDEADTTQIQSEIYRIGEWLSMNRQVELLLPEGFLRRPGATPVSAVNNKLKTSSPLRLDDKTLTANLSDHNRFVNADMLLNYYLNFKVQQIEDRDLYLNIRDLLSQLSDTPISLTDSLLTRLDYQQQKRSAIILQNIPHILEKEFENHTIHNKNAMLTIGLYHVNEMVRFLTKGTVQIDELAGYADEYNCNGYSTNLNLLKDQYGITVFIPKTLAGFIGRRNHTATL